MPEPPEAGAVGPDDRDRIAQLGGGDRGREGAAWILLDDELQAAWLAGEIAHRERARDAGPIEGDVRELPGPELHRMLEGDADANDVLGEVFNFREHRAVGFHRDRAGKEVFVEVQQLHFNVAVGERAAEQHVPGFFLRVGKREGGILEHFHIALDEDAFAGRALAFLAPVGEGDALAKGGVEDRLSLLYFHFDADGLEADAMRRGPRYCRFLGHS
jgi:hypothetical protein